LGVCQGRLSLPLEEVLTEEASTFSLTFIERLADNFDLMILGDGWKETGLNHGKPVYDREFSKVCSKAKIYIGILDPKWTDLQDKRLTCISE